MRYAIVPLESGNHSQLIFDFQAIDSRANTIVFGGGAGDPQSAYVRTVGGPARILALPPVSTVLPRLTGDGRRLYLKGAFGLPNQPGVSGFGLGFVTLEDAAPSSLLASTIYSLFSVDETGRRLAYVAVPDGSPQGAPLQYFLRDEETQEVLQLTNDPRAVAVDTDDAACPRFAERQLHLPIGDN